MSTAVAPVRALRSELERFAPRMIEAVAARGADEYVRRQLGLAMLKIKDSAALQRCAPDSLAAALIRLCGDRLEVGVTAHLVPMKGQCVYVRDWKGDAELMIRSGHVRDVKAYVVHARDRFRVGVVDGEDRLDWEPAYGADRGPLVAVFAIAKLRGGVTTHEVMTREEVDAIRAKAPQPDSPGWRDHYAEMAKKTVIHRIAKRLPKYDVTGGRAWQTEDGTADALEPTGAAAALTNGRGNDGYHALAAPEDPYADHVRADDVEPSELADALTPDGPGLGLQDARRKAPNAMSEGH